MFRVLEVDEWLLMGTATDGSIEKVAMKE